MLNIIGLNINHADSAACIIKNNSLLYAIEEERINRQKHWAGFPKQSIISCLKNADIEAKDIDVVSLNTNPMSNIQNKTIFFLKNYLIGKKKWEIFSRLNKKIRLKDTLVCDLGFKKNVKIEYVDHHISHIASGFYASGFNKSLAISIDGFGDFSSLVVAEIEINKPIKVLEKVYFPDSLGVFYEAMTQFAGFETYGEEYKFMALACLGNPIYFESILNNVFEKNNQIKLNKEYFSHHKKDFVFKFNGIPNQNRLYSEKMYSLFNVNEKLSKNNLSQKVMDIAASSQKVFEYHLFNLINKHLDRKFSNNLILSGGCALNSLSNGKILKKFNDLNLFVPFSPGDSGGALGSAIITNININKEIPKNLKTPYLGNSYDDDEIKKKINECKLKGNFSYNYYKNFENLLSDTSNLLLKNKVGGWFQDKMEFGPRALGNRSIIASPISINMKKIINTKIKKRENFRPFAPSILIEKKKEWFETSKLNLYMSAVEYIKKDKRKYIPAVTHFDGTGRVQDVDKNLNEKFYSLIDNFYKKSNVPILLNTSFNENEPIVNKPDEAIDCFIRTDIDFLVLGNFILNKNQKTN